MQKIFSTESSSAANKGQQTEHIEHDWTCQHFQVGKACSACVRLPDWLLVFWTHRSLLQPLRSLRHFGRCKTRWVPLGKPPLQVTRRNLNLTQQCSYRSNGSNFVFKMISELPWKFQVSKGLVNFFTESNVPRLAQDIHHGLVWQRAGEAGNVLWEGRWMGQLT